MKSSARSRPIRPAADGKDLSTATTIEMRKALMRLDAAVPPDRVFVTDTGRFMMEPWRLVGVRDPGALFPLSHKLRVPSGSACRCHRASFAAPVSRCSTSRAMAGSCWAVLRNSTPPFAHKVDLIVVVCNDSKLRR